MNDTANFEYEYEYDGDQGEVEEVRHKKIYIPSHQDPSSRHRVALRGYTGCNPHYQKTREEEHDDDMEAYNNIDTRIKIRGFTGFVPRSRDIIGTPIIPSVETQIQSTQRLKTTAEMYGRDTVRFDVDDDDDDAKQSQGHRDGMSRGVNDMSGMTNFRSYGKNMELEERYNDSIKQLWKRHQQTQQMLLRMVQSKLSSRVNSYASQSVRTRAIFDYFDMDGGGDLDEQEFRQFLELTNCYFDDVQSLALFAYFDEKRVGGIDWEAFKLHSMVHNPKGGTATIPKAITAVMNSDDWKSAAAPPKVRKGVAKR
jgi:Ca2+-binding EF-hand superfamily protein